MSIENEEQVSSSVPMFEHEQRMRLKFVKVRMAALARLKDKSEILYKNLSIPDLDFPQFQPTKESFLNCKLQYKNLKYFSNNNFRNPSIPLRNFYQPIQIKSELVPKDNLKINRTINRQNRIVQIPTPKFEILDLDSIPETGGIPNGITKKVEKEIIRNHQWMEVIEDMKREGQEHRVYDAESLVSVFHLWDDNYQLSIQEFEKIQNYKPKNRKHAILHPLWKPRVYDENVIFMNLDIIHSEFLKIKENHKDFVQKALDSQTRSSKSLKIKISSFNVDFETDSSDDLTDNEDFCFASTC